MNWRTVAVAISLLLAWGCYGYAITVWLDQAKQHCARHDNLAAECFAPHGVIAMALSAIFIVATAALGWFAWRR